jgi:oligoendopeptidase F
MKTLMLLFAGLIIATSPFSVDLGRYFANDAAEQADRATLLADAQAFEKRAASSLTTPSELARWLDTYETLSKRFQRHDLYVYLRSERNRNDRENAAADEALSAAIAHLDAAAQDTLADLGASTARQFLGQDAQLARYAHFIDDSLARAAHERQNRQAVTLLAQPALDSLSSSYKTLRQRALASASAHQPQTDQQIFESKWLPYLQSEDAFAALLLPFTTLQNGKARLQGFVDAPAAAYFRAGLSDTEVHAVLKALQASSARARYQAVVTDAAAKRLHVQAAELHAWNLDAADSYSPPTVSFPDVIPMILAAERPVGTEYAKQYAQLFDPAAHRVEWCREDTCDDTGFSVGYAGLTSGLFYGNYHGSVDSIRAVAHEAGHAVHRQFMSESQPLAVYNSGPSFMFESFAIFNELLLLDHLYRSAPSPAAKAYYLRKFLDDVTFQVYGSAQETDLEESIYAGAQAGSLRTAADLDALTLQVFSRYAAGPALEPTMKIYWARNRLYFTDPLYDVNYLFAGLLALEYLQQYESDPHGFSRRYVALLENGFTDTPQALERKFLDIDLDDADGLVGNAAATIGKRTAELAHLYATP